MNWKSPGGFRLTALLQALLVLWALWFFELLSADAAATGALVVGALLWGERRGRELERATRGSLELRVEAAKATADALLERQAGSSVIRRIERSKTQLVADLITVCNAAGGAARKRAQKAYLAHMERAGLSKPPVGHVAVEPELSGRPN